MAASVGGETSFQVADTRKPCQKTFSYARQARYVVTRASFCAHREHDETSRSRPASILAFHRLRFTRLDIREARIYVRGYLPGGSGSWNFFLFVRSFEAEDTVRARTRGDHRHLVISMLGTGATSGVRRMRDTVRDYSPSVSLIPDSRRGK